MVPKAEEELGRLVKTAPPPPAPTTVNKSSDAESREKKDGVYEGEDDKDKFCSVRSCFSLRSIGDEDDCLSGRTSVELVAISAEWFPECEGWPFGLWQRRRPKVVFPPPLLKAPADSWTWHTRNLSNVTV